MGDLLFYFTEWLRNTPLNDVAEIIHAHPTYSEITRSVLEYALGKQVDFVPQIG